MVIFVLDKARNVHNIMILSTNLLNLLGIIAIASFSLHVATAVEDLDDTLKQALFLVKLLRSDFAQILRSNDDVMANSTEENSTCSIPSEEFNSTMAMNETDVTVNLVAPSTPATVPPSTPDAPPSPPIFMPPGAPMMMPYASWPPMPMGYPLPSGPGLQNYPEENYRFPYRLNRRRMMPDYYFFDSPAKRRGKFRRFDNDPSDDLGNNSATSQAQTTSSLSSATSEVATLHEEETTVSTTSLPTTLGQSFTSILRTPISANRTILPTADSTKQSIPADPSKETILPTLAKSILLTTTSTKQSILPTSPTAEEPNLTTIILSTLTTKRRKRIGRRTRVPVSKAKTTVISNRNKNHLNVSRRLRHHTRHTTTTEKWTKDDVEISQVASELEKELEGTNTEDVHIVQAIKKKQESIRKSLKENKQVALSLDSKQYIMLKKDRTTTTTTTAATTTKTRTTTTMKVFLQGSSRIPIPFPENNGFCHFHPENALCGAN